MSTISLYVDLDLAEVFSSIRDEDLQKEVERRNLDVEELLSRTAFDSEDDTFIPLVEEALAQLNQGRTDDARLTLERALYPKWTTTHESLRRLTAVRKSA